jgi:hypothetical protein
LPSSNLRQQAENSFPFEIPQGTRKNRFFEVFDFYLSMLRYLLVIYHSCYD